MSLKHIRTAASRAVTALFIAAVMSVPVTSAQGEGVTLPKPEIGDDGLHIQPWFNETFLDLGEDLTEANAQGKRLVIFWEQRGCPYCKRMHEVNLRIPTIRDYVRDNFMVLQLNLWGDREVTDFDGEVLPEKKLAEKWGVLFTPTVQFFPETNDAVNGQAGHDAEVVRIPGYFKPFHFYFLFRYADNNGYESEPNFQRWLSNVGNQLEEAGVHYDLYADALPDDLPAQLPDDL